MPGPVMLHADHASLMADLHSRCFEIGWKPDAFLDLFSSDAFALGIVKNDRLVSFGVFSQVIDEIEILTLATDKDYRGQGLAEEILKILENKNSKIENLRFFLEVAIDNLSAIRLYTRLDYKQVGVRKGYYARSGGQRVDALVLQKQISNLRA